MKKERMTEQQYLQTKERIEEIKAEIDKLRAEKNGLQNKVRWYEYSEDKLKDTYKSGFAFQHFGKRAKDLNAEERREYIRLLTRRSRGSS